MKLSVIVKFFLLVILYLTAGCNKDNKPVNEDIKDNISKNKDSFFYINFDVYPEERDTLPIGIFDSGTGGLTVFDAIVNYDRHDNDDRTYESKGDGIKDFASEYFIYLADQANMPYGKYEAEKNTALLKEHIIKDVQFLLGNKYYRNAEAEKYQTDKEPVKVVVIACNTATAYGMDDIRNFIEKAGLNIKVIGVIGAGARGALANFSQSGDGIIAVMATEGTVASNGYVDTIERLKAEGNYSGNIEVFQQAGTGLAGAIDLASEYISSKAKAPRKEYKGPADSGNVAINKSILKRYGFDWSGNKMLYEGTRRNPSNIQINSVNNYIAYHVVTLLEKIKSSETENKLHTIILGCTHYPFYSDVFKNNLDRLYNYKENGKYIYRPYMEENIDLIDPAINTASELYSYLQAEELFNYSDIRHSEFYISVPNLSNVDVKTDSAGNFTYDYKYGRDPGQIQEYVKRVPMNRKTVSKESLRMIKEKIPFTYDLIKTFNDQNEKTEYLKKRETI